MRKDQFVKNWIGQGGGISWSAYWTTQTEVLFFGLYSEIVGGQMPNKVVGATDFLTVAGTAGSETYQAPNTAPYIAADTDYIWFKTDKSQRTTTTAELIGYDLQRTPVKYDDATPNAIVVIIILKSGEVISGSKLDKLFEDMWLPIEWHNDTNAYGHIKSNRIGQNLWVPESTYDADLLLYVTGLTTPLSTPELVKLNTFIGTVKTGLNITSLSQAFDCMYMFGGETSEISLKNLVKNAHHCTLGGATLPAFTPGVGFVSAGAQGYINTHYNPFSEGDTYDLSSCSIGLYTANDVAAGSTKTMFGNGAGSRIMLRYTTGDGIRGSLNATAVGNIGTGNSATHGFYVFIRNGNNIGYSKNGTALNSLANNANAIYDANYYIMGYNNYGTWTYSSDSNIGFFYIGRLVSDAEVTIIMNAVKTYLGLLI